MARPLGRAITAIVPSLVLLTLAVSPACAAGNVRLGALMSANPVPSWIRGDGGVVDRGLQTLFDQAGAHGTYDSAVDVWDRLTTENMAF